MCLTEKGRTCEPSLTQGLQRARQSNWSATQIEYHEGMAIDGMAEDSPLSTNKPLSRRPHSMLVERRSPLDHRPRKAYNSDGVKWHQ